MKQIASILLLALVALLGPLSTADARPTYFLAMKSHFAPVSLPPTVADRS